MLASKYAIWSLAGYAVALQHAVTKGWQGIRYTLPYQSNSW